MKNFLIALSATFISLYSIASFIAWDIATISTWHPFGRFGFVVLVLFISALYDAIKNESK